MAKRSFDEMGDSQGEMDLMRSIIAKFANPVGRNGEYLATESGTFIFPIGPAEVHCVMIGAGGSGGLYYGAKNGGGGSGEAIHVVFSKPAGEFIPFTIGKPAAPTKGDTHWYDDGPCGMGGSSYGSYGWSPDVLDGGNTTLLKFVARGGKSGENFHGGAGSSGGGAANYIIGKKFTKKRTGKKPPTIYGGSGGDGGGQPGGNTSFQSEKYNSAKRDYEQLTTMNNGGEAIYKIDPIIWTKFIPGDSGDGGFGLANNDASIGGGGAGGFLLIKGDKTANANSGDSNYSGHGGLGFGAGGGGGSKVGNTSFRGGQGASGCIYFWW
jgi:hypothetical protein